MSVSDEMFGTDLPGRLMRAPMETRHEAADALRELVAANGRLRAELEELANVLVSLSKRAAQKARA